MTPPGELDAVQVFASVVQTKSFRGAARALGVPKSTVSAKIRRLEDHLATRLLERTTRSVRLTDAGEGYYEKVAPALDVLREAASALGALHAQPTGRLRLTAPIELGQMVFGDVLGEYMRRHPCVEVVVELTDRHVDLVKEGFDLALRAGPLPDSSLVARKLGTPARPMLFASPGYLARRGAPKKPQDLRDHDCLVMSGQQQPTVWSFSKGRQTTQIDVRARARVNSFVVLRDLAASGHGIVRLPSRACRREIEAGTLVPILESYAPLPTQLSAVYPSARNVSPKVRAILELLDEWFASDEWRARLLAR